MSLRVRLFILISLALLVVLAVSVALIVLQRKKNAPPGPLAGDGSPALTGTVVDATNFDQALPPADTGVAATIPSGAAVRPQTSEEAQAGYIKEIAKTFVERYGTYSSDSNFENLNEVRDLSTPALWARLKPSGASPAPGLRVTTTAASTVLADSSGATSVVNVSVIRREEQNGVATSKKQIITVTLLGSGANWLVDRFTLENI